MYQDTIFAPITGFGGAINIIKISGNQANIFFEHFSLPIPANKLATICALNHNGNFIDQAIITFFKNPHSFTGEDVIEISLHGGRFILTQIIKILSNIAGFRMAEPGEFSKRSYINGKIDLITAEGINSIIKANTKSQHLLASKMLSGQMSDIYENFRKEIVQISALIEANIDFSDEDLPVEIINFYKIKISDLIKQITHYLSQNKNHEMVMEGIKVVIIGLPNVGKSSLVNFMLSREAAIVTDIPGTTRDSLEFIMNIDGMQIKLIDTAGIRKTSNIIEQIGIEKSIEHAQNSDIKIIMGTSLTDLPNLQINSNDVIVINKIDLNQDYKTIVNYLANKHNCKTIAISVKNKINIDILFKTISENAQIASNFTQDSFYLNDRHKSLLNQTIASLEQALKNDEIEIIAEHLRRSSFLIGQIAGIIKSDDILNEIFNKFCIGK